MPRSSRTARIYYLASDVVPKLKKLRGREHGEAKVVETLPGPRRWSAGATPARSTSCPPGSSADAEHRVIAWDEVGEAEGTGIVHIAPGCGREDFALGKEHPGMPVLAPLDESGVYLERLRLADGAACRRRRAPDLREPDARRAASIRPSRYEHGYPHCWRCKTELLFRLVDEWFIYMGKLSATRSCARASSRSPSRSCWIPDQRPGPRAGLAAQHGRLDDLQEALLGPGAADLGLRGLRRLRGDRRPRRSCSERAVEGWEEFEGHTPHRPWVDAVKIAVRDVRRGWSAASPTWAIPGSTPASCRFSTMGYNTRPRILGEVVPGRLHHRELSRASSATGSTRCWR